MGIQAMVKNALYNIRRNNTTNSHLGLKFNRRVEAIAKEIDEASVKDGRAQEELNEIVWKVQAEFTVQSSNDDVTTRLSPEAFERRQKAFLKADVALDHLKRPEADRRNAMEDAARRDYEAIKEDIEGLCQETASNLQKLWEILPTSQIRPEDAKFSPKAQSFMDLQTMMARVHARLATMQRNGVIDTNILVGVFHLEEPDETEPIHLVIPLDYTFSDLADDLLQANPNLLIPDFWIKRIGENFNRVTTSNVCWEFQNPSTKVCEVPVTKDEKLKESRAIDIVVGMERNYVIVLINKNGDEMGKVVELPIAAATSCTSTYMAKIFENYKVSRILDLREGTDASGKLFNKLHFTPNTNTLYVELQANDIQPSAG